MKMRTTESPEIPFLEGFQIVANVSQIIHILEDRLPKACNVSLVFCMHQNITPHF